jgi:hypothetical protein
MASKLFWPALTVVPARDYENASFVRIAIFSLTLVLGVGAWACSDKPRMEGIAVPPGGMGALIGDRVSATPTATPQMMPSP